MHQPPTHSYIEGCTNSHTVEVYYRAECRKKKQKKDLQTRLN
uniref:Uncharacterized protein n=1 Tax=Rhizophora mucronata TaxID=61149 RepID=A0A2P2P4H8_RHIMU